VIGIVERLADGAGEHRAKGARRPRSFGIEPEAELVRRRRRSAGSIVGSIAGASAPDSASIGHRPAMVAGRLPEMAEPSTPRAPRPDDLYAFRIPTDPRLSPDGRQVVFALQAVAPAKDGYRRALWTVPTDGSQPARRLTIGAKQDSSPRFSPDGRTLAFISDRRLAVEELPGAADDREDGGQVHLLPLDGPGEARRLTDLPRGVEALAWSPDGRWLAVLSASRGATRKDDARRRGRPSDKPAPDAPPPSDYHYIDRLQAMANGAGFVYGHVAKLWIVDAETGEARLLVDLPAGISDIAWSPDGSRIAFAADLAGDRDLGWRSDVHVVDVESGRRTRITAGRGYFAEPAWLPDGRTVAVLGHRYPAAGGSRTDVWLFRTDGSESAPDGGRNLSERHDLMPGSGMNSDLTIGEPPRLAVATDGRSILFSAPVDGSYELWRIAVDDGALERLTDGRHYLSGWDAIPGKAAGAFQVAVIRSSPTELPDVHLVDVPARRVVRPLELRRLTDLNRDALAGIALVEAQTRWTTVDGRRVQGWHVPAADPARPGRHAPGRAPLVLEIHGGPHSLYGWSPSWEFQCLAGAGIGVWYANPRGSEGYGQAFNAANFRDWGLGPTRDVLSGVDALVADGLADPERLGVTGGSYGGYLTSWIVGHDQRFRAAISCRSVNDLTSQMMTGDIAGPQFGRLEFGAAPWEDPALYREQSPLTHAGQIRTPLLIQHSENDLRTPIGQGEELFTVLRSLRRPVRMMRVPGETHELTRSGTPFRRVENLVQVGAWFRHYLVEGKRGLPPMPRVRAGR
jgi:acylaminoacyl-peptidase